MEPLVPCCFDDLRRMRQAKTTAVLFVFWSFSTGAQTISPVRPLSLKECIQLALGHNLDVKIERFNPAIARHSLSLAYGGFDPIFDGSGIHRFSLSPGGIDEKNRPYSGTTTDSDSFSAGIGGLLPSGLSYDLSGDLANAGGANPSGRFENSQGAASIQLRQPLLKNFWIDSTRLNIRVSRNRLKTSELALRQQIMNTVTSVELAYYDLMLAQESVKVQEKALQLAEELLDANRERVKQGVLAALDEKQAESLVAVQRSALLAVGRARYSQQNVLKGLLSDRLSDWADVTIEPTGELSASKKPVSRQESWQKGMTMRPDFLQAKLDWERFGLNRMFNYNQLFPQVDMVGSYGHSGSDREYSGGLDQIQRGSSPFYSYGVVMAIPLSNRAARARYKISKAEQQQAQVRLQKLEQTMLLQIDDAVKQVETAFARVGTTREARQFAEMALEAEQTKLENGKSISFYVLQLQRDLTAARSEEVQALAEYNKGLARLALSEGTVLERHELKIEVK